MQGRKFSQPGRSLPSPIFMKLLLIFVCSLKTHPLLKVMHACISLLHQIMPTSLHDFINFILPWWVEVHSFSLVSLDKLDRAIVAGRSLLELVYCLQDGDRSRLGPLTASIPEITGHLHMRSVQGSSPNTDTER